jgi:hypothetical protein
MPQARKLGLQFIDAPVSGGQAGAQNGLLTVMCGGDRPPLMPCNRGHGIFARLHAAGRQRCRAAGQDGQPDLHCRPGAGPFSEAIAFGQNAGLDMVQVLEVIGKGAAQSWQMDNRGKTMVADKFDFGFAVDWMRKDLGLVLDEAQRNGARAAGDGAGGPVLWRRAAAGRQALGHVQPDQAPGNRMRRAPGPRVRAFGAGTWSPSPHWLGAWQRVRCSSSSVMILKHAHDLAARRCASGMSVARFGLALRDAAHQVGGCARSPP